MRTIGLYALGVFWLSAPPLPVHALSIDFCVPDCSGENPRLTVHSALGQTSTDANGVTTTTVPIATVVVPPNATSGPTFTVTATVTSQQSGTLQKITFNPTTITANTGSGCTTTAPCRMEVLATSDPCDFPTSKPAGGYPAGVFMMGSFTGTQASGNGDTISMTGEASGATASTSLDACTSADPATRPVAVPVTTDVINATPGTGPANTGVSLPSSCTGSITCKFMASAFRKAFNTQITETVQQTCADGAASCLTRLQTKLNVELKTVGNRVSLPLEHVTANPDPEPDPLKKKNPTLELTQKLAPSFGSVDVRHLAIGDNDFLVTAKLKLDSGNAIDPVRDEVFLSVGPFSMSILPGKFKRLLFGRLFTFFGKVDGRDVFATFARDSGDANVWTFIAGVHNVQLQDIPELQPPLQVPVHITVGTDTGKDLVTARFF